MGGRGGGGLGSECGGQPGDRDPHRKNKIKKILCCYNKERCTSFTPFQTDLLLNFNYLVNHLFNGKSFIFSYKKNIYCASRLGNVIAY